MAASPAFSAPFVAHDSGTLTHALVVRPSFALETVPPIQGESSPIAQRAFEQHDVLIERLRADGVKPIVLEAQTESPCGVVAADLAVVFGAGAVLMRPSDLTRRAEVERVEQALLDAQIPILGRISAPGVLDGGDVLIGSGTLYVAVQKDRPSAVGIPRTARGNALGRAQLAALADEAGMRICEVAVASQVRRLRGIAAFIDRSTVLLASELLDAAAFEGLERIDAPEGEAYGAGVLVLGSRRAIANVRFRRLLPVLRRSRVSVDAIDLWEFGKLGITPSSLVLALKRA